MHMVSLGSLLRLREAYLLVGPVWWAQTQQAEDCPLGKTLRCLEL